MLPKTFAPMLFGLLLSGMMSLLVSGLADWRKPGLSAGFVVGWAGAWLLAWPIALPAVLLFAPLARRAVNRLVADAGARRASGARWAASPTALIGNWAVARHRRRRCQPT